MLLHLLESAVHLTERGYLPDSLTRYGVRHLLTQRLQQEEQGDCAVRQERFQKFLEQTRQAPIAVSTDKANERHYEVPAEFFQKVLGNRLKYSCCYWPKGVNDLSAAEEAALRATCERADLRNGMRVLELGCGWGSLTLWMAEHYPDCQITAVSNSSSQRQYIQQQARERNFENVTVVTADMNDFDVSEAFDRVVSIEMFEHMRNHQRLMERVARWLKPDGKLFVHIFCHREFAYLFETEGAHNWMGRHFFTGGMMPSENLLLHHQHDLNLLKQWRWNGMHYAQTCEAWLQRQDAAREQVLSMFEKTYGPGESQKWFVRWRLFFIACAELFAYNEGNEWWVAHYLFQKP